ncbi:hypothetical protein ACQCR9_26740, partial [Ralstonia pseudosolanacearum]
NAAEFAAFLDRISAIARANTMSSFTSSTVLSSTQYLMFGQPDSAGSSCDSCTAPAPSAVVLDVGHAKDGAQATAPVQSTVTYTLGKAGQILSGGNLSLTGSGDLTNAGDLAAAGKVKITAAGTFTNQGTYVSSVTTTAGCLPGAIKCAEGGAHVDTLNWQQTPNTVAAG